MIKDEVPLFLTYIETIFKSKNVDVSNMLSLVTDYLNLNCALLTEDKTKKDTIDMVFKTLYNTTLDEIIKSFNIDKNLIKIETEESRLRKRVGELEETIGELRDAYWNLKHRN